MSPRRKKRSAPSLDAGGFLREVTLDRAKIPSGAEDAYPFSIPAVRGLSMLELHPKVTFLVGENGSGKSTLIEAIAVGAGFNAEGGSKSFDFSTRSTHSELHRALVLSRGFRREKDGFFLRAETFYNVATKIDELGVTGYGGVSLHDQSHGESFLALANNRFRGDGLYVLDEPEAALSPLRQLSLLKLIDMHVQELGSQFVIATHSPILMAYPEATIFHLEAKGIRPIAYEETEHYTITKSFLDDRQLYFRELFGAR